MHVNHGLWVRVRKPLEAFKICIDLYIDIEGYGEIHGLQS